MQLWMTVVTGCVIEVSGDRDREELAAIAGDWTCSVEGGHEERLSVTVDEVSVEWFRQVGREDDPVVPYPTSCRYVERGDGARIRDGRSFARELRFDVREVTGIEDPLSEGDCAAFVAQEQARADDGDGLGVVEYDPPEGDAMDTSLGACVR